MYKNGLKNFFHSLIIFWVPLLTLALGFGIGMAIFLSVSRNVLEHSVTQVNDVALTASVDFNLVWKNLLTSVKALDWKDPTEAMTKISSPDWFAETFTSAIYSAATGTSIEATDLGEFVQSASSGISRAVLWLVILSALGIIAGHYLTSFLVRRRIAKRAFWKIILAYGLNLLVEALMVWLCVWLAKLSKYTMFFSLFLALLLSSLFSLFQAYMLQGWRKIPLRDVVNFKNAMQYMLCTVTIWVIAIVPVVALQFVYGLAALVAGIVLLEIAIAVNNVNAEAYVKAKVEGE